MAKLRRPSESASTAVPDGPDWRLKLSILLFVGSGCSALIYEVVWFQLLELVVGSSAISLGILLGTFMGGLCLGSLLLPRMVSRRLHPFRVYAAIEFGIGLLALVVLIAVPFIGSLYMGTGTHGVVGVVLRAVIAGLCLLPPTVLMGATLPAVARWVEETPRGVSWLGLLYGSNIAGGIVGCVLAGFYLLRFFDVATATVVGVAINGLVGLIALLIAGGDPRPGVALEVNQRGGAWFAGGKAPYVTIGVSGLCALGAQVVWTRLLSLLLGATVYTFSIILAVFLAGLWMGSSLGAMRARSSRDPRRDLGLCQLALALATSWTAFVIGRSLPYWPIAPSLSNNPWNIFQLDVLRCGWAILPATILWGASFPLALAAAATKDRDPGRLVGGVYAANTVGAIVGAATFSLLVIPGFGTQVAQQILVGLAAAAGLLMVGPSAWPPWKGPARAGMATVTVLAVLLIVRLLITVPPVPGGLIALGRSLATRLGSVDPRTNARYEPNFLYVGEGISESVAVTGSERLRLFHVSGKIEASTSPKDMRLQRMLPHIPALIHPGPRSVLVVGFGAGVTAGAFVLYPSVERIVICEIEPLVIRDISRYFRKENYDVLADPRVEVVYDDARHYMLTTREKFDIITSDPIHPWVKGSAALYSLDYFELVRRRLNPGGVVSQWVPLYQSSERTIKGELATFFEAFPNGSLWANLDERGKGYDLVLVGTDRRVDLDALEARLRRADHRAAVESLGEVGFPTLMDLLLTYAGRRVDLVPWLSGAQINRDRRPWLQYQAGMETYTIEEADIYNALLEYRRVPEDFLVGMGRRLETLQPGGQAGR